MGLSLKTIAIADDEPSIQELLQRLVSALGYECVGTAANGQQAVDLAKTKKPQLITMDIHMPIMDGILATQEIMKLGTTSVVIVTADIDPDMSRKALEIGACGFLRKPFDIYQVNAVFENAWNHFQTTRTLVSENLILQDTLETRKLIEKAKGILMEQQHLSEEDAHRALQKMSQDQAISLKEVCRSVIQVRMVLGTGKRQSAKSVPHR